MVQRVVITTMFTKTLIKNITATAMNSQAIARTIMDILMDKMAKMSIA